MVPSLPADVNARCVDAFSCVFLGTIRNAIMAQRCEFREVKTIFYGSAQRMNKISFLTRENKIHIFKLRYNFLFIKKTKSIINRKLKYSPSKQHCPTFPSRSPSPSPPPSLPPSPSPSSSRSRCCCCCCSSSSSSTSSSSSSSFASDFGSSSSPSFMIYLSITSGISVQ